MPADTDPNTLVDLTDAADAPGAEIVRAALQAAGIDAFAFTAPGWVAPWDFGSTRPYRVQVRRADLARARDELAVIREETPSIDWDAQDVGDPDPGELAAVAAAEPARAASRADKRGLGRIGFLIGSAAAFPLFGFAAIVIEIGRRLLGKPRND